MNSEVKAWEETVFIPTYEIGEPEKNPVFLEKRVYQGSSGVVFPYPVIEKIKDEKINKAWNAVFLENDYLKIMLLPELGGRVQMAYDKVKKRHFVYYNQVIKPALVGLTGPWISGGIEFNWPQHHRPSTYDSVDFTIEENADGSKTVWCSEIERMFCTKGMAGFTLYPDKAYLEIKVQLYNRTALPQTFLWWANPAVKVNDHYQSVFPPDVNAVFDHGKRDVSEFPIAKGTYYKVDYSPGTDISRYKNIPVPTSYMAIKSEYDFIGCYENDTHGGMLHVANHHVSPGKKQWTWGNGDFGYAWDRNLTDEDGPYIELMCGVYTDNQPDFSWLMPYEEKSFKQYFMPYRDLGVVKNATKELILNFEAKGEVLEVKIYSVGKIENALVEVKDGNKVLFSEVFSLAPTEIFEKNLPISDTDINGCSIVVYNEKGKKLISWQNEIEGEKSVPEPAKAAKAPEAIVENEQLFLTGLHLEQYRHATFSPADYYLEALRRDPGDVRCNNAMGKLELKKGKFAEAESYFRKSIVTLVDRNPNPYDGEPYFNLGIALRYQSKDEEAFDAFYKATWNDAWQGAAYFQLTQLALQKGDHEEALELIDRSLIRQWHNHKARYLKTVVLRLLSRTDEALLFIEDSLKIDRFNFGCLYEKAILTGNPDDRHHFYRLIRNNIHNYIELALDYSWAGLHNIGAIILNEGINRQSGFVYPMAWYYLGWMHYLLKNEKEAQFAFERAEIEEPGVCFPNQLEAVLALNKCIETQATHAKACYYLGNFYYHFREAKIAIELWEKSISQDDQFPTAHRNLALAYYNKADRKGDALLELEKAFELDSSDARILMELDALYKRMNYDYAYRMEFLNRHSYLVNFRDDVYLERLSLLNLEGEWLEAKKLLLSRRFHPWEGGEGRVTGQYLFCQTELAKDAILNGQFDFAVQLLEEARIYPENFGEGKLAGAQENDLDFWLAMALQLSGKTDEANHVFERAAKGLDDPSPAMFYNDQQPDNIFYQGLALLQLGRFEDAAKRFRNLLEYGEKHLNDKVKIDYFAVSLPDLLIWDDDLNLRNKLHCTYLMGLGWLGLNELEKSLSLFHEVLSVDRYHLGAFIHQKLLKNESLMNYIIKA